MDLSMLMCISACTLATTLFMFFYQTKMHADLMYNHELLIRTFNELDALQRRFNQVCPSEIYPIETQDDDSDSYYTNEFGGEQ